MHSDNQKTAATNTGHPPALRILFLTEMWERFSFYGLRPLLVLFMSAALADRGFGFDRNQASAIVGIYAASVYLSSLPGGWIADRLLGLRRAILYGALLIAAGHISIGFSSFANGKLPFFVGLILIVFGTGLLKPNISAIVGELYPEGGSRRDAGFSILGFHESPDGQLRGAGGVVPIGERSFHHHLCTSIRLDLDASRQEWARPFKPHKVFTRSVTGGCRVSGHDPRGPNRGEQWRRHQGLRPVVNNELLVSDIRRAVSLAGWPFFDDKALAA